MNLEFRKAVPADASLIVLRESDEQEALAWLLEGTPDTALAESIRLLEDTVTAVCGEDVVLIGGHSETGHEIHPWMMCSAGIVHHRKAIYKASKLVLASLIADYPDKLICNYVYKENLQAKRFLSSLGFRWVHSPGYSKFDFFYLPK